MVGDEPNMSLLQIELKELNVRWKYILQWLKAK